MAYNPIDSIGKSARILSMISKRQEVLGTNLANMDTPGYTRKDVNFTQYLGNIDGAGETGLSKIMSAAGVSSVEDTGENVNAADELISMQNNSLMYTVATRRVSNVITQMKTVLNVGK